MVWNKANEKYNKFIRQLFHAENWHERAEAARQLGIMKDARVVNLLCRALRSEEEFMVQNRIIEALGKIGDSRATMRIIEKLDNEVDKNYSDKFRLIFILEALSNLKDKRSLVSIAPFLNSPDEELKELAEKAFDKIEPDWRLIMERELKKKSIEEIFKIKL
ncbi:MAG: HEAT repeat domain-containing protein [Promethearchaeota archaeon]|nr:MAG: HEAT repeat domain-containing protein [Candidatus Lokiarchaeota archaeon]